MPGCGHCGEHIEVIGNQVGRRDTCPSCGNELRTCRSCRHFEPAVAKGCKEPFAEVPLDKDSANFCEFFQVGDGRADGTAARASLLESAEALFKKR